MPPRGANQQVTLRAPGEDHRVQVRVRVPGTLEVVDAAGRKGFAMDGSYFGTLR
jgi:hypothetical protein